MTHNNMIQVTNTWVLLRRRGSHEERWKWEADMMLLQTRFVETETHEADTFKVTCADCSLVLLQSSETGAHRVLVLSCPWC